MSNVTHEYIAHECIVGLYISKVTFDKIPSIVQVQEVAKKIFGGYSSKGLRHVCGREALCTVTGQLQSLHGHKECLKSRGVNL